MAGNGRFELSSPSADSSIVGNYSNGQRGNFSGPSLGRSGSFRDSNESRRFGTGKGASRGSNTALGELPPLSQCLMLESIAICEQKMSKTGELRRALGFSALNNSEDSTLGASHLNSSPLATMDELKRYRATVADTCGKASGRAKKLDEHLHKLNKYCEVLTTKKQQRNELLCNDRPGVSFSKMGAQIDRSPSEFGSQKVEERPKNVILNKRVRTSVAETRAEFRTNGQPRQSLPIKDCDTPKEKNADIDVAEEKIRRLPAGGDSWDKRMKKKRSIGVVGSRASEGEAEMKRPTLHKPSSELGLQTCDPLGLRVGATVGAGAAIKTDGASLAGSNARAALKKEQEKSILSRDIALGNKDRLLPKASFKLSIREEIPNAMTKIKAPHRGGLAATNIVSNAPSVSPTLDSWELPPTTNKNPSISGVNNRNCSLPTGSSSPPIAKWGGHRPQKISRTRRANLVSPVSNHGEGQTSSEDSPDFGAKLITSGANESLFSKSAASGNQIIKVKPETVPSPARVSESEDSCARENRLKEKGTGISETEEIVINLSNIGSQSILSKSKFLSKDGNPDGVRRQGRSGRGTSVSRVSISPGREKLDNGTRNKPLRQIKPTSDKNGSKTGRPLKKISDRKGFPRLGLASDGSPDLTWDSEDDREELTSAANMAYNSKFKACSSIFWKKVESVFADLGSEEESYLAEQIRLAEEYCNNFSQILSQGDDVKGDHILGESYVPNALSGETNAHVQNGSGQEDVASKSELVNQFQSSILGAETDSGQTFEKTIPLYQRVLSALIADDEPFAETGAGSYEMHQNSLSNSLRETQYHVDSERNLMERSEFEHQPILGVHVSKNGTTNGFVGCNGYANYGRYPNSSDSPCNGELLKVESEKDHSNDDVVSLTQYNSAGQQSLQDHSDYISPFDHQYDQITFEERLLIELQSVGLYPETVPDLHDKEEDEIDQEIAHLKRKLHEQTARKKMSLNKMHKEIQGRDTCGGDLEHVAMNKLVELAYKKLLATKGNLAIKIGIPKVSKQIALAFARRALARCRRFEESGVSCFNEPTLRDIISAVPPRVHVENPSASASKALANGSFAGPGERGSLVGFENFSQQMDLAFSKSGPISNRGKKKEVLLDDFVGDSAFRSNLGCSLSGGAKGKRSDRDKDKDASMKNGFANTGRSLVNSKGDRKTKTKHKQRTVQPMYASVCNTGEVMDNNGSRRREVGLTSSAPDCSKEKMVSTNSSLNEVDDTMEEDLGVESDIVAPQDLNSWFNFDIDGIQEDHDAVGLEIPMDDLSELMF